MDLVRYMDIDKLWVYRIIPIQNLEYVLQQGLYCKNAGKTTSGYVSIGSKEVISRRDTVCVKCYPDTVVNDYVPFYFSTRTPMLYNIITGVGTDKFPQQDIIYLCCKFSELATGTFQWCYTDGNAAIAITTFFNTIQNIETNIDWRSVKTPDFKHDNADGDHDRIRKKHAEFLVKSHVPSEYIKAIVVLNASKKNEVEEIINRCGREMRVFVNPNNTFYFE